MATTKVVQYPTQIQTALAFFPVSPDAIAVSEPFPSLGGLKTENGKSKMQGHLVRVIGHNKVQPHFYRQPCH